jgi:8-oxo-dGTP pyrophosphatase MutT (NUDIX family)
MSKGQNKKETNPWVTQHTKLVYSNPWIQVQEHQVLNPAGNPGIYGVVSFKNVAVGIVPIDSQGFTYLVGQYRYTLNQYSWEIPEGGGPIGEEPLETAKRELLEETGLEAVDWLFLTPIHTSNSVTDESGFIYMARNLKQGKADPEETEELSIWKLPLAEAISMVERGEISDSLSIAGLLMAGRKLGI